MGFLRQEHWSGLPVPSPGNLPDPRIEPLSSALQVNSLPLSHRGSPIYIDICMLSTTLNIYLKFIIYIKEYTLCHMESSNKQEYLGSILTQLNTKNTN